MTVKGLKGEENILSLNDCKSIARKVESFVNGSGSYSVDLRSVWRGYIRWSRNKVNSSGDDRQNTIRITRDINGAASSASISNYSDAAIRRAVETCERFLQMNPEKPSEEHIPQLPDEIVPMPRVWFPATVNQSEEERAAIFHNLTKSAEEQGMLSAGYIEVMATAQSRPGSAVEYFRHAESQLSITVRSPDGSGSGWAGVSWDDWKRIDGNRIAEIALDKCLRSRNPVSIEPGRYSVILEPQAVHDLVHPLFNSQTLSRQNAENPRSPTIYTLKPGYAKLGLRIFDHRLKVHTDPYHPDCSFAPYRGIGDPYVKATWVEAGILVDLPYSRIYAISQLQENKGLRGGGSYILEGVGEATNVDIETMVENTERGLWVTRFQVDMTVDDNSMLATGLTRDGLWLIEKGKVTKSVKNMRFTESPLFMLNNIEEYGLPVRVFSPGMPCLVPAIRAKDFSFTATSDAV